MLKINNRSMAKVLLSEDKDKDPVEISVSKEEIGIAGWGRTSITENMRHMRIDQVRQEIQGEMEIILQRGRIAMEYGGTTEQEVMNEIQNLFASYYRSRTVNDFSIQADRDPMGEQTAYTIRFTVWDGRFNQSMGYRLVI